MNRPQTPAQLIARMARRMSEFRGVAEGIDIPESDVICATLEPKRARKLAPLITAMDEDIARLRDLLHQQ